MAYQTKVAVGYNGSPVAWVGPDEVAWTCGNAIVLQQLSSRTQRVLKGVGFGIGCFAVNKRHHLIAITEKGLKPNVLVFSTKNLQLLAKLSPGELSKQEEQGTSVSADKQQLLANTVTLAITALAFSADGERLVVCGDEPDCSVIVYSWRKGEVLGRARLPASQPASHVSFHPLDPTILATTGGGVTSVWYLEALWDRTVFRAQPMAPGCLPPGHQAAVHTWSPHGLYLGTSAGGLALLDVATMAPQVFGGVPLADLPSPSGSGGGGGSTVAGSGLPSPQLQSQPPRPHSPQPQVAVVLDASGPGAGVSALALNRDYLAVGGTDGSVHVFSHAPVAAGQGSPEFSHEVWLRRGGAAGVAIASIDCGGPDHASLVLGCPDGTIYRAAMWPHTGAEPSSRAGYTLATLLADYHVGKLSGVVPHPGGGAFLTAGADGTVRLWASDSGQLLARKALSSAQCALAAAAPGAGLVAVGSETGVVRVLVLPPVPAPGDVPPALSASTSSGLALQLKVMYRRRLHTGAVDALAFSPNNDLILSTGRDGAVWLLAVDVRTSSCRALGYVPLPNGERVLSVTWPRAGLQDMVDGESALLSLAGGGVMSLAASAELSSGNWRNPHADMMLVRPPAAIALNSRAFGSDSGEGGSNAPPEPVVIKLLRLEVPMLAVATLLNDRSGDVYGLGADKQLHKLSLPAEAAAWAGLRARPFRSGVHVMAHTRPGGGVAMAPGGHMLVTGGADGAVQVRNLNLGALGESGNGLGGGGGGALHDVTAGGIASVSYDASGRYFASAGADGAVFLFEVLNGGAGGPPAHQLFVTPPWAAVPYGSTTASRADVDDIDDPAELTEVELRRRQGALDASGGDGESKRAAVAARLSTLRNRIAELLAANEAAPELERLERSDLIVDLGLVEQLKRDTEARAAAVAASVRRENLRTELLAERLKRMVWDSMAVKGAVISGLRSTTVVHNFPLTQPGTHERVLRQVAMLRRVEMLEHQVLGVVPYQFMFRGNGSESTNEGDDGSDGATPTPDSAAAAAAAAATAAAVSAASNGSGNEPDALMYSDFDLHCNTRKALQMHLLKQKIRDLKASFNVDFNRVSTQKRVDCDRIADLNARIDDTAKDLRKMGAGPPPGMLEERYVLGSQDTRDNIQATVLTVRDEEVGVERYVTPEERARQEAVRRAEEEAAKRSARDNAGERALRQMMGGTLAAKGSGADGEGNPFSLPPPPWLVALGIDPETVSPKLLSDEQARELKEWQAREKAMQEERARRVGVLELELRTAKATVEDVVGRFDEALTALSQRRHRVAAEMAALEARVLVLATGLANCARTSEAVEKTLLARLGAAKEAHGRAATELSERRAALAELDARQSGAAAEERLLDRNFKKEFADADMYFNRLLQLYRARRLEQMAPSASGGGGGPLLGFNAGSAADVAGNSFRSSPAPPMHRQGSQPGGPLSEAGCAAAGTSTSGQAPADGHNAPPPVYSHPLPVLPSAISATSLEAFPELPPGVLQQLQQHQQQPHHLHPDSVLQPVSGAAAVAAAGHSHGGAAAHAGHSFHGGHGHGGHAAGGSSSHFLDHSLKPEGLDLGLWERFVAYRADRLAAEVALRGAGVDIAMARRDFPELECREAVLSTEMEGLMSAITALRTERRTMVYDNEVQLRLLAGQVEAAPPTPASANMSDARLLGRSVVEALNAVVLGKGTKKVDILFAMKDFKRGIYASQWEAAAADMQLDDLRAKIRDLQLLHVTRDMQTVLKDGEDRSAALEAASLEALMKQRERLHLKALEDKRRRLAKMAADVAARSAQNQDVAVHLVTLGKVLEEQQRLQAGMQSSTEQAARRMRSLVTHKKLKEIALAQQNELAELRGQLSKLRLKTYPTFLEPAGVVGLPAMPHRLPPDLKVLASGPKVLSGGPSSSSAAGLGENRSAPRFR